MFTIKQIRNGARYLRHYLSEANYYTEGEAEEGFWLGKGAARLGLKRAVTNDDFVAIASNQEPRTGERLTPRKLRNALHDITWSAPKAVSLLAIVGEDGRVLEAFRESVVLAHQDLENYAAVRVRGGENYHTENFRFTRNLTTAVFIHSDSRAGDPQLHAHLVSGNFSYDESRNGWFALQPRFMMEATKSRIRHSSFRILAEKLRSLGYPARHTGDSIRVDGITSEMEEAFSQRSMHRKQFCERYETVFGEAPNKRRIEQFIKDDAARARRRFRSEFETAFGEPPSREAVNQFVQGWRESKSQLDPEGFRSRWSQEDWNRFEGIINKARESSIQFANPEKEQREAESQKASPKHTHSKAKRSYHTPKEKPTSCSERKKQSRPKRNRFRYQRWQQARAFQHAMVSSPGLALLQAARHQVRRKRLP